MTTSWVITESALFDWSYSWTGTNGAAVFGDSESRRTTTTVPSFLNGTGAFVSNTPTTLSFDQRATATLYTSTVSTRTTSAKTSITTFVTTVPTWFDEPPELAKIYDTRASASWNSDASAIDTFAASTTATRTRTTQVTTSVLSVASTATFLEPVVYIPRSIDGNFGWNSDRYCPTVYAWSSAAGWEQSETSSTNTQAVNSAALAFSGQVTVHPPDGYFQPDSSGSNFSFDFVTVTLQSQPITWTRQTTTAATSTRASGGGLSLITRPTQTYTKSVHTTQTSSSLFSGTYAYRDAKNGTSIIEAKVPFTSWWDSTQTTATTFANSKTTTSGGTTTTRLVSTVAYTGVDPLIPGESATFPYRAEFRRQNLRKVIQFGGYQQFATHNAGFATNTTQAGGAALSHGDDSFVLPPQAFSTVLLQAGITAPLPNQTRSRTSSNSTTSWSLGVSRVSITTSSTNSTTFGTTTSAYELAVDSNTIWTSGSSAFDVGEFTQTYYLAYLAAGGIMPTQSFFAGGGLFTATQGTSEFTGSAISHGSGVTAIAPLPYFEAQRGVVGAVNTFDRPIATSALYLPSQLQTIGFPLTA